MGRGRFFTSAEHETMRRMWAEGATAGEIARVIGRTNASVRAHSQYHRDEFERREPVWPR